MKYKLFTEEEISNLRSLLAGQGVVLPQEIENVASGVFGTCIIFTDGGVLKLLKWKPKKEKDAINGVPSKDRKFYHKSTRMFFLLSEYADEICRRGIAVPKLTNHGKFRKPFSTSSNEYHAWQFMTRLEGTVLPVRRLWGVNASRTQQYDLLKEMSKIAAGIHVPVHGDKEKVFSETMNDRFMGIRLDQFTYEVLHSLQADINRFWSEISVKIHGDFHPGNVMTDKLGKHSVFDWDYQKAGHPIEDFRVIFSYRPDSIRSLTDTYNRYADNKIDFRLVTAKVLVFKIWQYSYFQQFSAYRNGPFHRQVLKDAIRLSQQMYNATGRKIYANFAGKIADKKQNPLHRPVRSYQFKSLKHLTPRPK